MRRTAIAVFMVMLAAMPAGLVLAQSQDYVLAAAKQSSQQGNHDTAIALLRAARAQRPDDEALKGALADALMLKRTELMRALNDLSREINALRPPAYMPGCGDPADSRPSVPVRVGGNIAQPMKVKDVKPVFPAEAMANGIQGIVIMEATIDCGGNVVDAKVLRGVPQLNDAALDAVKKWQYTPTLLNGMPVPVIMTVTMTFTVR